MSATRQAAQLASCVNHFLVHATTMTCLPNVRNCAKADTSERDTEAVQATSDRCDPDAEDHPRRRVLRYGIRLALYVLLLLQERSGGRRGNGAPIVQN